MKVAVRHSFAFFLFALFLPVLAQAQTEKKAAFGILIDNTGTLRTQFQNVQILSNAIARSTSERGFVALFNFETSGDPKKPFAIITGTNWTLNQAQLTKHIGYLAVVPGQTTLFEAIRNIGKSVDAKANSEKLEQKIIVLVTDGEDRASEVTHKELIKELKASGVKVYAIGLVEELSSDGGFMGPSPQKKSKDFLKNITKETGGNVIFPRLRKETKVEDLLTELFAEPSKK